MGFHDDCLVFDGHTDVPTRLWEHPADLSQRLADRHVDLPRLRQGGVDALVFALYLPASLDAGRGLAHAEALYRVSLEGLPAGMAQATTADEIVRTVQRGEVAVDFALENGRPLGGPGGSGALDACAAMGVRYVTLTHWASHEWCDASTGEPVHGGLSEEGVKIVRELNRRSILPDVSHVSDDAVLHVLDVSRLPPVASHSSARALCEHPRNLPDSLIREIARKGGVVMANSYPAFVSPEVAQADAERMKELLPALLETEEEYFQNPGPIARERARLLADRPLPRATLGILVDHVIHLIEQAGEEHVGIGTDFDGVPETLDGFEDPSRFPDLTAALLSRGVDRSGVKLILGGNFLRLLQQAEQAA
jgi:membrane dipeptidase